MQCGAGAGDAAEGMPPRPPPRPTVAANGSAGSKRRLEKSCRRLRQVGGRTVLPIRGRQARASVAPPHVSTAHLLPAGMLALPPAFLMRLYGYEAGAVSEDGSISAR